MTINKCFYSLLIILFYSCQGQKNESINTEKKEMKLFTEILLQSNFKNSKENFENINGKFLGIKTSNLVEGYNEIKIFNESIDYQLSKGGNFIKIGNDILPDLDSLEAEKKSVLINQPYFKRTILLNKIIYSNDPQSSIIITNVDIDLARDIVVLFNYEEDESLLKKVCDKFGSFDDLNNNFILSTVFYNKDTSIRNKLLKCLAKDSELIYNITFYLVDNKTKIININNVSSKKIDMAVAFLLKLGLEGKVNDDIDTDNDKSYRLLNNIFISYPNLIKEFENNDFFGYDDLKYFAKIFNTEQESQNQTSSVLIYKIHDTDGYTNLRSENDTQSPVIAKINTGTQIEVLYDKGNWWYVQTADGKKGYIHKSKIVSE